MPALTLYTRKDCCLCDDMKACLARVLGPQALLELVDVDETPELASRFGSEVPVLFIDGRKAFKYRVSEDALRQRLSRKALAPVSERRRVMR